MIVGVSQEVVRLQTAIDKHSPFVMSSIKSPTDGYVNNSSLAITYTESSLRACDQLKAFQPVTVAHYRSCTNSVAPLIAYSDVRGYICNRRIASTGIDAGMAGYVVEARVYLDDNDSSTRTIFSTREYDGATVDQLGWALCVDGASNIVTFFSGTYAVGGKAASTKRLQSNRWHTISLDVNRVSNDATVYVDGMKIHEFSNVLVDMDHDQHYVAFADAYGAATSRTMKGVQHACRIWNRTSWFANASNFVDRSVKRSYRADVDASVAATDLLEFSCIPLHDPNQSTTDIGDESQYIYNTYALNSSYTIDTAIAGTQGYRSSATRLQPIDSSSFLRTVPCDPYFSSESYLTSCSVQFNKPYDTRAETMYSASVSFVETTHALDPTSVSIKWLLHPQSQSYFHIESYKGLLFASLPGTRNAFTFNSCCGTMNPTTGLMAINTSFAQAFRKYYPTIASNWNISAVVNHQYTQVWVDMIVPAQYTQCNHGNVYHSDCLPSTAPQLGHCASWTSKLPLDGSQAIRVAAERY